MFFLKRLKRYLWDSEDPTFRRWSDDNCIDNVDPCVSILFVKSVKIGYSWAQVTGALMSLHAYYTCSQGNKLIMQVSFKMRI